MCLKTHLVRWSHRDYDQFYQPFMKANTIRYEIISHFYDYSRIIVDRNWTNFHLLRDWALSWWFPSTLRKIPKFMKWGKSSKSKSWLVLFWSSMMPDDITHPRSLQYCHWALIVWLTSFNCFLFSLGILVSHHSNCVIQVSNATSNEESWDWLKLIDFRETINLIVRL